MARPLPSAEATRLNTLTSLITTSSSTAGPSRKIYPNDDIIVNLLQSRSRFEHPYTRLDPSSSHLIIVNPLRSLGCMNEESRRVYQSDVDGTSGVSEERQPSPYELAGRVWMLMHRRQESQSVVYQGVTGSGKSTAGRHFTSQILALSSTTKEHKRLSDQITSFLTILESFGHSKTPVNPSASQHSKYFELHFSSDGSIAGAKILPFGLNKSRVGRLRHEERSFHVFYQLLAGASPEERDALNLDEPSGYSMLASSGCFRLPGGPFSDDSTQLQELRVAMASLGFKAKHVRSIFTLLTAILLLSNLTFGDERGFGSLGMSSIDERSHIVERNVLVEVAAHLGVSPDDLEAVLVNRTKWVRRDLCSMFLDSSASAAQRDSLMRDLYAILWTWVVEMANKRLALPEGSPPELQIIQLDMPGFQSRTTSEPSSSRPASIMSFGPLVNASGENGFDEFASNYINEMVHTYLVKRAFEDASPGAAAMVDGGIKLPAVVSMTNGCLELLNGPSPPQSQDSPGGMAQMLVRSCEELKGEEKDNVKGETMLASLVNQFGRHSAFVVSPGLGTGPLPTARHTFGINHWAGNVTYDCTNFADRNTDVLDKQLVDLLRSSSDPWIAKLVSGPGLATEGHPLDPAITVEAQVSITPLRTPTPILHPLSHSRSSAPPKDWSMDATMPQPVILQLHSTLSRMLQEIDRTRLWTVSCIRPNDSGHPNSFDKRRVKAQVRSLLLAERINRRQHDFTSGVADYSFTEFCVRQGLPTENCREEVDALLSSRGWIQGEDYGMGQERVWMGWSCWKDQEDLLRSGETRRGSGEETLANSDEDQVDLRPPARNRYSSQFDPSSPRGESSEDLLLRRKATSGDGEIYSPNLALGYQDSPDLNASAVWSEHRTATHSPAFADSKEVPHETEDDGMIVREKKHHATEIVASTRARKWWLRITWALTWWIPSFLLRKVGRMERADIRMAWREKVAICMMIMFACGVVIFYIIVFGMLLCPDSAKAWNPTELATHQGETDYYAAIAGKVYDFTTFYKGQHSDIAAYPTSKDVMLMFAGQDLTNYFPPPMTIACPGLVTNDQLQLLRANFTPLVDYAVHTSGPLQTIPNTALDSINWYESELQPALQQYYKGSFVYTRGLVADQADNEARQWAIYSNKVYDLSDYFFTQQRYSSSSGTDLPNYSFFNKGVSGLFQTYAGQDITKQMNEALGTMSQQDADNTMTCLNSAFYVGELDYRLTPRCTVQNYLLLAFSIILFATLGVKFLAALQLGSKRQPELLDKFVICQVPCYTEGEESLKRTIDSLAVLKYDDKRKLIFIICDGNIIGSGNNRPTPRIVLDILGVDVALDPEPLLFKSIGEGSKQLNYAKVYSGLYEHEGHVVPYVVVVKVGKPTETSKPGNRGKRDSQVMLLHYLNRVHFDAPMSPLELEIYHQMRNVIGIDPTFYEYIFQVDADTTVEPDSLNRLIACASDDQRIIGICGETKVENERESLTTMIQVYEYYISHHLTKAFESLFGSVTCLPGCFSVYRIRTADKGRPVIISSIVIDEYAEPNVDTLHKKNLFSLGEDRYLTTLMMKHFPTMKMKFTPDAIAHTVAPSRWNVLLSQRRRWINSTIHNLVELLWLPEMCGFCFFSMRFVVFLDLVGTIILPATFAYLVYLVIVVSTGKAAVPIISLAMIAAVYGLQAIIFILKREFMLIGWMFVYILAFPIYSVFLPLYSFWSMDDFSWGNTRKVVGEGSQKTIVYDDDEPFHDSMIPYKSFNEYEANAWETASVHSEKSRATSHVSAARTNRSAPQSRHTSNPGSRVASMYSTGVPEMTAGGDYWRDSSPLGPSHSSANLRHSPSHPTLHHAPSNPYFPAPGMGRVQSMAGLSMWGGGSGYDSPAGIYPPHQPMAPMMTGTSAPINPFESRPETVWSGYGQPPPSVGGMGAPRNTIITNLGGYAQRGSSYSLATVAHPLAEAPRSSQDPNPSDEKVLDVLRKYLAAQNLMTVTKRQTREAVYSLFPNADLQPKAGWINQNIDKILSEM